MIKKPKVEVGEYKCVCCKLQKTFKPQVSKSWSKGKCCYIYRINHRCRECQSASLNKWRKNNREKYKAHGAVFVSLRNGFLKKEPCEICGSTKVEAHHVDYSKPLDVIWYCKEHHVIADSLRKLSSSL